MLKKDKKNVTSESTTISTLLGRDTVIEGTLSFKETIRVDGRISGKLNSTDGTVIVGENAVLDADIKVAVAVIRGKINGCVEASQRVEIYAPAHVNGDICAPTVAIDSGVIFNGNCKMQNQTPKAVKAPKLELKQSAPQGTEDQKVTKNL